MSATRLLVLGVVRSHGEAHGYQVRRELQSWSADRWANVQPGSIYHALKKLAKDGLLTEVGTVEAGTGPERTAYRITPDGDTEFLTLVARGLSEPNRGTDSLSAAVTFLTALPRAQAVHLLEQRAIALDGTRTSAAHSVDSWASMGKPDHVTELARLWLYACETEIRWTRDLIAHLQEGHYVLADDAPDSFGSPPPPTD